MASHGLWLGLVYLLVSVELVCMSGMDKDFQQLSDNIDLYAFQFPGMKLGALVAVKRHAAQSLPSSLLKLHSLRRQGGNM